MRNKKIIAWVAILAISVSVALVFGAQKAVKEKELQKKDDIYKQLELFSDAISIVRADYVEEVQSKELIYGALKGMVQSLDKYSEFMDPETYTEMRVETEGEFGGIGIEIAIKDELLTVIAPIEDTPAYKAGLKAGDRIVKIEAEITRGITLLEAVKKLRGKPGTKVSVTILREDEGKLLDFTITRDIVKVKSVREAKILEDKIGYIKLAIFQERSAKDLEDAIVELEKQGADSLILDLRNNPGGLLNIAVDVAAKFLPAGKVVVSTKGRIKQQNVEFKARDRNPKAEYPLVLLVDRGSASGSEIVAGAVQDHKRGIVVGTKTFGKGSVQTVIPLADGSAIRLTTSRYYTPNGRSIHGEGITPDIIVEREKMREAAEKPKPEEIFEKIENEQEVPQVKKEEYDNQLIRAIDVIKTIKIYKTFGKG